MEITEFIHLTFTPNHSVVRVLQLVRLEIRGGCRIPLCRSQLCDREADITDDGIVLDGGDAAR